jgi:alcohol dehydrogenase/L-iditol 2-dehydrogenase
MTALVNFAAVPGSVELREVPVPEPGPADVLLKVEAVAVCGSDIHQWGGTQSWGVNYPCVLGHEFCGTIEAAGAQVTRFHAGDRVVSETAASVDEWSPLSRSGLYNLDPSRLGFGYGTDGAMAEYVKVPQRCLHVLPASIAASTAALTEPCCVAYSAVAVNARIRPGDVVLVLGAGPIGLLCALVAKRSGAGRLIVAGLPRDAGRLEVARQLGADAALDSGVLEHIRSVGDGYGADVVVDAAGVSATLEMAMAAVRPAGQIVKVGWGRQPLNFSLDPIVQKAVTLHGSFSHNWPVWERVLSMLASGQLQPEPVVSRVAPLAQWRDCFERMRAGEYLKTVLTPR